MYYYIFCIRYIAVCLMTVMDWYFASVLSKPPVENTIKTVLCLAEVVTSDQALSLS